MKKRLEARPAGVLDESPLQGVHFWAFLLFVVLATLFVFHPALQNGFVNWDDDVNILENPHYRGLGWTQLKWMFTTFHMGPYQPLSWLSLGADYVVWGMSPFGYHLTSILLHAAGAALFYLSGVLLLSSAEGEDGRRAPLYAAACFGALCFSIHPLRAESVAWVTERRDVLSGVFYFATVLAYLRGPARRSGWREHLLPLGLFVCALLSKAIAISLPVVLLALDLFPLRRLPTEPRRWGEPGFRGTWLEKIPYFLLAGAAAAVGAYGQSKVGAVWSLADQGWAARLAQPFYGVAFYLWKTVSPYGLINMYEAPRPASLAVWPYWPSLALTVGATLAFLRLWRRWPAGLLVWLCYLATLAPVLGFVKFGQQVTADRYSYHACLGWALLCGGAMLKGLRARSPSLRAFAAIAAVAVSVWLGILCRRQALVWRDSESLWRNTVAVRPGHIFAHNNLGTALSDKGKLEEAISHYNVAMRADPYSVNAYYNLGNALAKLGRTDEAIAAYRAALKVNGGYAPAHNNLAVLLSRRGGAEALEHFGAAAQSSPASPHARLGFGNALLAQGKVEEALVHLREAARLRPEDAETRNALGIALARKGDLPGAAREFQAALSADPRNTGAYNNLGAVLTDLGRTRDAIENFRAALKVDPACAEAHNSWGNALFRSGDAAEAGEHYAEAVRIKPTFAEARHNLAVSFANRGRMEEAAEQEREALRLRPDYFEANFSLGNILATRGRLEEAAGRYREALRLRPGHPEARKNLDAVERYMKGIR